MTWRMIVSMRHPLLLALLTVNLAARPARPVGPEPREIQARLIGPAFRQSDPAVLGCDGAYSLSMGHGRSLWFFGDTLLGRWGAHQQREIQAVPPNTQAVVQDSAWQFGFPGARFIPPARPSPILPSKRGERVWPMAPWHLGHREMIYFVAIAPRGHGPMGFRILGHGLAQRPQGSFAPFRSLGLIWPGQAPAFGSSVLRWQGRSYVYAGGPSTYLARLDAGDPGQASSYRYWEGHGRWGTRWQEASPLPGSGAEMSVRYDSYLRAFVMIDLPPLGTAIEARFAPRPWGPWSAARRVFTCQPVGLPGVMFYGAKQHAELDQQGGRRIVISYNTNGSSALLRSHPELYWPRLVQVTLTR